MATFINKLSITKFITLFFILSISLLISVWIIHENEQFEDEIQTLINLHIKQQKDNIKKEVTDAVSFINYKKQQSENRLKYNLKDKTNRAYEIIQSIHNKYKDTKTKEEIIDIIKTSLRNIRSFDGRGYFFIVNTDYTELLYPPNQKLENTKAFKDFEVSKGVKLLDEFNKIALEKGEGFYTYKFIDKKDNKQKDKFSFIKYFEPYGFYIGLGEYLEDFEKIVKQEIFDRLSSVRFGKDGYLFIDSWDGEILMHPLKPQIVGKNLINLKDPNGIEVIKELINASKKPKGDFVYYSWSKPSENNKVLPKISFAMGIPEYEWMVGAGQYIDDLNNDILQRQKELEENSLKHKYFSIAIVFVLFLILFFIIKWWEKRVKISFDRFINSFKKASTEHRYVEEVNLEFQEFQDLAKEFNRMIESRKEIQSSLQKTSEELSLTNKHLSDSIKVASAIQKSVLPNSQILNLFVKDFYVYYEPKDIVSGDIYLFEKLSNDELLIFNIDCTGHGVGGAFITMLVKAIQKEIIKMHKDSKVLYLENSKFIDTSKILNIFNFKLKSALNQQYKSFYGDVDVGFDGSVFYINKEHNLGIYSSANSSTFILEKSGQIKILKSDKYSVGYKKSELDHEFKYYFIDLHTVDKIYLTTDGMLDQLGGQKGFPFAKRRFMDFIKEKSNKSFENEKDELIKQLQDYQGNFENIDDRTVIALKI
jgi:signal transduction histidine kinase/serine phosphatase RsbU (regulator of sigma subunit)